MSSKRNPITLMLKNHWCFGSHLSEFDIKSLFVKILKKTCHNIESFKKKGNLIPYSSERTSNCVIPFANKE